MIFLEERNEAPEERALFVITADYLIWHLQLMLLNISIIRM